MFEQITQNFFNKKINTRKHISINIKNYFIFGYNFKTNTYEIKTTIINMPYCVYS